MTGPRRILVAGYYGAKNAGDEAILSGLLASFRDADFTGGFTVLSHDPADTQALHGIEAVAWTNIEAVIDAAEQADLIVVGGGGLFHDYWGVDPTTVLTSRQGGIAQYATPVYLAAMLGKPCVLLGVGVGPLQTEEGRDLTRTIFDLADLAFVRDQGSLDLLKEIGASIEHVTVASDLAFAAPRVSLPPSASSFLAGLPRPILGVALRHWAFGIDSETWESEVAQAIDRWQETTGGTPLFVPMQTGSSQIEDDVAVARRMISRLRRPAAAALLPEGLNPLERFWALGACDLVLGMRMHALMAAASSGVPCIGLAYDPKVYSALRPETTVAVVDIAVRSDMLVPELERLTAHRGAQRDPEEMTSDGDLGHAVAALTMAAHEANNKRVRAEDWQSRLAISTAKSLASMTAELAMARRDVEHSSKVLEQLTLERKRDAVELEATKEKLAVVNADFEALVARTQVIERSKGWGALQATWHAVWRLRDVTLPLRRALDRGMRLTEGGRRKASQILPRIIRRAIYLARVGGKDLEDNSEVVLFTDDPTLFPTHRPRRALSEARSRRVKVSLVAIAKDEEGSARSWLESISKQTRLPDEVIIVDNGSKDSTLGSLLEFAHSSPFPMLVKELPALTLARCRNEAVEAASFEHIAFTDFGCEIPASWLDSIVAPFELDGRIQVVAGWYTCGEESRRLLPSEGFLIPGLSSVTPQTFLPATRSMALTKVAWMLAGKFPEWLTYAGEDTYLGLELKRSCPYWAFVPAACVKWLSPQGSVDAWRKVTSWAAGDGESGAFARRRVRSLLSMIGLGFIGGLTVVAVAVAAALRSASAQTFGLALIASAAVVILGLRAVLPRGTRLHLASAAAQARGFLLGVQRRPAVLQRRFGDVRRVTLILAGVPLDDTGGGSRGAQLAFEFLRKGDLVVYVHEYPRQESVDLRLAFRHPNLITATIGSFDWESFRWELGLIVEQKGLVTLVEFPSRRSVRIAEKASSWRGPIVYDKIDEWNSELGGSWFKHRTESALLRYASHISATSPQLARQLRAMASKPVIWLPNAVNSQLFDCSRMYPRPTDLPVGKPVLVYVGALWGSWFDWQLLADVAIEYGNTAIVLIGDRRPPPVALSSNVYFLGLKAQSELPAYLAHSAVGIVPWKSDAVTLATSPLKVYEYIAMGLPVVAPDLEAVPLHPLVLRAQQPGQFIDQVAEALLVRRDPGGVAEFVRLNSWGARADRLDSAISMGESNLTAISLPSVG